MGDPSEDREFLKASGYFVVRLLGEGGAGRVYEAVDVRRKRRVAVKLLFEQGDELEARFQREGRLSLSLRHPHLVSGLALHSAEGRMALVFEFHPIASLLQEVEQVGVLPQSSVLTVLSQIGSCLSYLHEQGVLHRDVKPSNVLIDAEHTHARLCDLGVAKDLDAQSALTHTGFALGTLGYLPPEALRTEGVVGSPADVYGLGGCAYYLLTGQLPFPATNLGDLAQQVFKDPPPNPCALRSQLSHPLGALIVAMLAKEASERPTAARVAAEAGRILARR